MARQHDAELCERIRQLEERVRDLEARPQGTTIVYPSYPQWHWTNPYQYPWTVTSSASNTTGGVVLTNGTAI